MLVAGDVHFEHQQYPGFLGIEIVADNRTELFVVDFILQYYPSTRRAGGRVVLEDEIDDKQLGTIVSDDLNPQKARVLLMLAMNITSDKQKLQKDFFTY